MRIDRARRAHPDHSLCRPGLQGGGLYAAPAEWWVLHRPRAGGFAFAVHRGAGSADDMVDALKQE